MRLPWRSKLCAGASRLIRARERVPKWFRRVGRVLAAAAVVVLMVDHGRPVLAGLNRIDHVREWPLLLAIPAEAASCLALTLAARQLLRRDGISVRLRALLGLTLAGLAMSSSLPAGDAASSAYWVRELGREGVGAARAGALLVRSLVWNVLTLAALLVVGVALAGHSGPLGDERTLVLAVAAVVLVAAALLAPPLVRFLHRRYPSVLAPVDGHLGSPMETPIVIVLLELVYWGFDFGAFVLVTHAAGVAAPLAPALVVYCLGQIAAAVPLLPGGAGTVEATLLVGFRAFGFQGSSVLAGVLVYRIVSTWGLVPVGWGTVLIRRRRREATFRSPRLQPPTRTASSRR